MKKFLIKKNKKRLFMTVLLLFVFFCVNFQNSENSSMLVNTVSAADEGYKNMEKIPGQLESTDSLVVYLNNLYKFGIAISAILAFIMISYASFIIMISGVGNASKITDAKSKITDAIFGLILAMTAYLILFVINPDLIEGTISSVPNAGKISRSGTTASSSANYAGYKEACPEGEDVVAVIEYSKIKAQGNNFNNNCTGYNEFFEKYGANISAVGDGPCILKAIAQMESQCGKNQSARSARMVNGYKICGIMQLAESTAGVDCAVLNTNDEKSIEQAAAYIKKNIGKVTGTGLNGDDLIAAVFAGYNSGYEKVANGKTQSLGDSGDCDNVKAFQCCKDLGGLKESIHYAWNGIGWYKKCIDEK